MPCKGYKPTKEHLKNLSIASRNRYDSGGIAPMKGRRHSKEAKRKMVESQRRRILAADYIPPRRGKKNSLITRQKISIANKNKKRTKEQKKHISEGKKGIKLSSEHRNHLSIARKIGCKNGTIKTWNKGLTKETDDRVRQKAINSFGEKHPNWQGGKSFEPYSSEFNKNLKEQIRKRDYYRCQECFRHENELRDKNNRHYKMHIHHIDYDKRNNNPENLISLCLNCHSQTNFKRNNWIRYFKDKISNILNERY